MKKYTLGKIIDFIFKNVVVFFIAFVWIRFYVRDLYLTLFLTTVVTVLFGVIITLKNQKSFETKTLSNEENKQIHLFSNEFLFSDHNTNLNFFNKLAKQKHTSKIEGIFIKTKGNILIYPYYKKRKLNSDDFTNIFIKAKQLNPDKLIITCKEAEQEVLNLTNQIALFKIIVLNEKETYFKLLKAYETYPEITNKMVDEQKLTFQQLIEVAFNKNRTKGYFISGIILLFASLIIRYNLYYIIISSLMLTFALFSYSNKRFNKKTPDSLFE